jgi:hypothetical protein
MQCTVNKYDLDVGLLGAEAPKMGEAFFPKR